MVRTHFDHYKHGLHNFSEAMGSEHPRFAELDVLKERLVDNLIDTITYGSTPPREAARAAILDGLNRMSLELFGKPFDTFCAKVDVPQEEDERGSECEQKNQDIFRNYTTWLNGLLIENRLQSPEVHKIVSSRTLKVLKQVDSAWRGQVLQFLFDAKLIDKKAPVINMAHVDLTWVSLVKAHFPEVDLTEANLEGSNLAGANLLRAKLIKTSFIGGNLGWSNLEDANLAWADMSSATLTGAHLERAYLRGATLGMSLLKMARLEYADLESANLLGANLQQASLRSANLAWANLLWANLEGTDLKFADLNHATYNQHTRWPEGFDPVSVGAVNMG